jgi:hypothetical protein
MAVSDRKEQISLLSLNDLLDAFDNSMKSSEVKEEVIDPGDSGQTLV